MPGEGPPTDVPPAAGSFGRFRALHQLGTGSLGPVFRGEDPDTGERVAIKHLQPKIGPERSRFIAEDLRALIPQLPEHQALARMLDAGLEGGHPFVVTALAAGESLDIALREYGPAVLSDALPRLERMAEALDLAAQANIFHGALSPRDVMVSARDTKICGLGVAMVLERATVRLDPKAPYAAPERDSTASAASDRYSFAAIAYEWIFGRAIDGPAETPLTVPQLPGADVERLAGVFTTALAPQPAERFATCAAFVAAMREAARASPERRAAAILPFDTDEPAGAATLSPPPSVEPAAPTVDAAAADFPLEIAASRTAPVPPATPPPSSSSVSPEQAAPVFWRGSLSGEAASGPVSTPAAAGFSAKALAAMLLIGVAIGVVGGYLLANARRPSVPPVANVAEATPPPSAPAPVKEISDTPVPASGTPAPAAAPPARASVPDEEAPGAARAVRRETAPAARKDMARLLVRTTPAGASVTVDGTPRGTSPLALRDLEFGTRTIVVARPGYVTAERKITLTADRPSRSVDVALVAATAARPPAPRPAPAAAASGLVVDSRPPGAVVTVDGTRRGTTPLTIESLAPGTHTVRIELPGYRPWSTTIDVKAGERPRVAASLVGGT